MKKHYFYPLLLCTAVCITACNKEDAGTPGDTTGDKLISLIGQEAQPYQQRMEVPKVTDQSMFIVHSTEKYGVTYTEEWDKENRTQRWAAYSITDLNAVSNWSRKNWEGATWQGITYDGDPFQEDPVIPAQYRTHLSNYSGSGYTRGHIVNSQDRLMSQNANGQTVYATEVVAENIELLDPKHAGTGNNADQTHQPTGSPEETGDAALVDFSTDDIPF